MDNGASLVFTVLDYLLSAGRLLPMPFETPYHHANRIRNLDPDSYGHSVWKMQKRGVVKVISKNGNKFLTITKKGELQVLLEKARLPGKKIWDGKWRLVMFDIPESSKDKRSVFRSLLKSNNFYKLQASVYISPFPLNREAIRFLQESMLIGYIRILRVDEMDNDKNLKKRFGLK